MRQSATGRVKKSADDWFYKVREVRESNSGAALWPYGLVYNAPRIAKESAYYVIPTYNLTTPLSRASGRFLKAKGIPKKLTTAGETGTHALAGGSFYWGLHTAEDAAYHNTLRLTSDYMIKNYLCSLTLFASIPVGFRTGILLGKNISSYFALTKKSRRLLLFATQQGGVVTLYGASRALMAQMVKTQAEHKQSSASPISIE